MIFDGESKTITLETTALNVTSMWSDYIDWLALSDNSKYQSAMRSVGGDDIDLVSGTKVPPYIYLLNGWKIRPMESNHTLNVTTGILLVDGGGDPFTETLSSFMIRVNYSQPVQAITVATGGGGGSGSPTAIEIGDEIVSRGMLTTKKFIALK